MLLLSSPFSSPRSAAFIVYFAFGSLPSNTNFARSNRLVALDDSTIHASLRTTVVFELSARDWGKGDLAAGGSGGLPHEATAMGRHARINPNKVIQRAL